MSAPPYIPPPGGNPQGVRELFVYGTLTQGFGNTGFETFHDGIDIVPSNSYDYGSHPPVPSLVSGTVVYRDWDPQSQQDPRKGYGKKVAVEDAHGDIFWAGHLTDFYQIQRPGTPPDLNSELQLGQKVYAGDTIGHMGDTGYSTAPHIHYGIHDKDGHPLDVTLGAPPVLGDGYGIRTNVLYAYGHDIGWGAGDNQGHAQKWAQVAPPPGYSDAPISEHVSTQSSALSRYGGRLVGVLAPNPGNPYGQAVAAPPTPYPTPVNQPPGSGTGTAGCTNGQRQTPNLDGTCPQGFEKVPGTIIPFECVCTGGTGAVPSLGDVGAAIEQGIFTVALAIVGVVFIAAGLWALTKEGPVNAVTEPIIGGTKAVAKVAAL